MGDGGVGRGGGGIGGGTGEEFLQARDMSNYRLYDHDPHRNQLRLSFVSVPAPVLLPPLHSSSDSVFRRPPRSCPAVIRGEGPH